MSAHLRSAWIAWAVVCVVWGTTYFAIKIALETIPPFLMGGLRYVVAGSMLALWVRARGRSLPALVHWPRLFVLGFLMLGLGNGGVVYAEQYIASGLTAVLIATSPFWMVAVDAAFPRGEKLHARQWIGLAVGFAGIVLLVWPDLVAPAAPAAPAAPVAPVVLGVLALQIACIGWSVASSYTRRHALGGDVLGVAALQMIFGGVAMLGMGTIAGEWPALSFNGKTTAALWYLIIPGSLIGFAAYSHALRHLPIAVVSLYTYINPVIAVALGTVVLGEPFHLTMIPAGLIIVLGILIVRPAGAPRRTPAPTVAAVPRPSAVPGTRP